MAASSLADLKKMSVKALDELYEDLWAALGPQIYKGAAAKRRATAALLRKANAVRVRTIIDPLDQKGGKGGAEASKRYALYEDGQTVTDFLVKHGDGPHLRLDVQRGNIRLAAAPRAPRVNGAPAKRAKPTAGKAVKKPVGNR